MAEQGSRDATGVNVPPEAAADDGNGLDSASPGAAREGDFKLRQVLGLFHSVTIIVGVIIGTGIFVSPKGVLLQVGSVGAALLVWVAAGAISFVGSMCYAELGTMIPRSGADYSYLFAAFGSLPAFLYMWAAIVVIFPTGVAVNALTFAHYVLQPFFPACEPPEAAKTLIAAAVITLVTVINCWSVKWAARLQAVFTVAKLLALALIVIVGIVQICRGRTENFQNAFEDTSNTAGSFALALYSGFFAFYGWSFLNFVTEEVKNPSKNLPRAIWISVPLVTAIYVLANVGYFAVLTPREVLVSNAVAVTFAERTLGVMTWIMPLCVAASTFGGIHGGILVVSRLFFAGARAGHLPEGIAFINKKFVTPMPSLVFFCLISLLMLSTTDVYALINYRTFVETGFSAASVASLLYLRWKRPDAHRPIKVHTAVPIFYLVIEVLLLMIPLFSQTRECLIGLLMVAMGIPVYVIGVTWKNKPMIIRDGIRAFNILIQKLFYCLPEEVKRD